MPSQQELDDFVAWMVDNGGFIHESVKLTAQPSDNSCILKSTAPIPASTVLIRTPHSLALSLDSATASLPACLTTSNITPHAQLTFHLCQQRLLGTRSKWTHYITILPKTFDTPLYFSPDDLKYLTGCNMTSKDVDARRSIWQAEWEAGVKALGDKGKGYTWDLFLWAATVLSSRAFLGSLLNWTEDSSRRNDEDALPVLFPLIDAANHRPLARVAWLAEKSELGLETVDGIEDGCEVFNNYGPKSNEELLMGYGFCIPDNPTDTVVLKLGNDLPPSRKAMYQHLPQPVAPGLFYFTPSGSLPPTLLVFLRLVVSNEPELAQLANSPATSFISTRNTLLSLRQLIMALRLKITLLLKVDSALPPPTNSRQSAAVTYRRGQTMILQAAERMAMNETDTMWKAALGGTVWTLAAAMEDKTFARAVGGCFGSQDPEDLEEVEQQDVVFVLFICWMYIRSRTEEGLEQWLTWIDGVGGPGQQQNDDERKTDDDDDAEEIFHAIFPDAAEEAPEVFGRPEWTMELLRWGLGVFRKEAFELFVGDADGGVGCIVLD